MNIYLAARYNLKDKLKHYAGDLRARGLTVTSRWLDEIWPGNIKLGDMQPTELRTVSLKDIADIEQSDVVVLFTEDTIAPRGGHHFESGYAYGRGKSLITVGPRENCFHFLETVLNFATWDDALRHLTMVYGDCK